tara:strand:+ start:382 stop:567 length:186 start_codon:yes stop_codon:yes gene_type:complete
MMVVPAVEMLLEQLGLCHLNQAFDVRSLSNSPSYNPSYFLDARDDEHSLVVRVPLMWQMND